MAKHLTDDGLESGLMRWFPAIAVIGVLTGFVALAWYAYHAGTQSVKDEDLLVVEADKTPIKEKPVDAGGMQIPNQDKTIYDTFTGNTKEPVKVERVLPTPEEPVAPPVADSSDTAGWINENSHSDQNKSPAKTEQMIAPDKDAKEKTIASVALPLPEAGMQAAAANDADQPVTYVAKPQPAPAAAPATPAPAKEEKKKPAVSEKPVMNDKPASPEKPAAAPADNGALIQLGAYRSEGEAKESWAAMQKKHTDLLGNAEPIIIKADLGSRGIYYRLRVGGFAGAAEAKALCSKLNASGQQCIIPIGK